MELVEIPWRALFKIHKIASYPIGSKFRGLANCPAAISAGSAGENGARHIAVIMRRMFHKVHFRTTVLVVTIWNKI